MERIYGNPIRIRGMKIFEVSTVRRVISSDVLSHHAPIELTNVGNASNIMRLHTDAFIKNLSGNRTSGTKNLCAINSARRLNEKLQHGGIHYARCH